MRPYNFKLFIFILILLSFQKSDVLANPSAEGSASTQADSSEKPLHVGVEEFKFELPSAWQDWTFSDFLGVSEVFNAEKPNYIKTVSDYSDIKGVEHSFDDMQRLLSDSWLVWQDRLKLSSWDLNSLLKFKMEMASLLEMSGQEKQNYYDFVKKTDDLVKKLKDKKTIFDNFYRKAQSDQTLSTQLSLMKAYVEDIQSTLSEIQKIQIQYAKIYKDKSGVIKNMDLLNTLVDEEIAFQSEMRFYKSHPSFFEDEFFSFFNETTRLNLNKSLSRLVDVKPLQNIQTVILGLKYLFGFLILGFVLYKVNKAGRPYFPRPWAWSWLFMLLIYKGISDNTTPLADALFWVFGLINIQILLSIVVRHTADLRSLRWLVAIYGLLQVVNAVGIPQIFYRVLIVVLALALGVFAYLEVIRKTPVRRKAFDWMMKWLIVLSVATALAQILGYHLLSVLIFQGALQSVFSIFIAWQIRHALFKFTVTFFNFLSEKKISFFIHFKNILLRKFRFISDIVGVVLLLGLFTRIWGLFASWGLGVTGILDLGIPFKSFNLTLGRVLQSYLILYATHFLSHLVTQYLDEVLYPQKGVALGSAKAINALISYVAWVLGLFGAFSSLGFQLEQFAIIAGALSLGIGFGLQNIVNNFISGLILIFERPIKVGDLVNLGGEGGIIEKVGLRSTIIRTASKTKRIVPNSELITQQVENLTHTDSDFRLLIPVGVAYGTDPQKVKRILLGIAAEFPEINSDPMPQVLFVGFGESALNFELLVWIPDVMHKRDFQSDIHFRIEAEFRKHNVQIPFPQRDVYLHTMPTRELGKNS